ncbi:Piso0_001750 [Millerozyma farinosa CBS 7064]|uniref:Piso0_001750 protein n=1 Tax=Pichia sorbitophila (strain ATCC MYA-4447 / BCRC 22081 / CBS 7064 / NBRC 10061 / NRRL Y-12695) TaxID=559304 RepID=G8YP00_PICSO|nr:Piso0_001750 [Millerozyma farinosa CBS 7064]
MPSMNSKGSDNDKKYNHSGEKGNHSGEKGSVLVKRISRGLTLKLSYLDSSTLDQTDCVLSIEYNKQDQGEGKVESEHDTPGGNASNGWFGGFFGTSEDENSENIRNSKDTEKDEVDILLGHAQLFGAVVLGYNLSNDEANATMDFAGRSTEWWNNRDFLKFYNNDEQVEELEEAMGSIDFIRHNLEKRMVIGDKLGGLNDLVLGENRGSSLLSKGNDIDITEIDRYFLSDLVLPFNSAPDPFSRSKTDESLLHGVLSLNELTGSLIPFYSTPQSLLFSNIKLSEGSSQSVKFSIKNTQDNLPPEYNTKSTGLACDHGLVSIKYSLVISLIEKDKKTRNKIGQRSVYFPFELKNKKIGHNERWMQHNYLQEVLFDRDWSIYMKENSPNTEQKPIDEFERESFLEDLDHLIGSNIKSIPKISTHERKRSTYSVSDFEEDSKGKTIPQIPKQLRSQYTIRLNTNILCDINLLKPYFFVGEDINFIINVNVPGVNADRKIAGIVAHLESEEIFHTKRDGEENPFIHAYKVTPSIKINTLASSIAYTALKKSIPIPVCGTINIPASLTNQFQSSLFDLKHYISFKITFAQFEDRAENFPEIVESEPKEAEDGNAAKDDEDENEVEQDITQVNTSPEEPPVPSDSYNSEEGRSEVNETSYLSSFDTFKANKRANEFRFRLPLSVFPNV